MVGHAVGVVACLLTLAGCDPSAPAGRPTEPVATTGVSITAPGDGATLDIVTQIGDQCPHRPPSPDPRCDPVPRAATWYQVRDAAGTVIAAGRTGVNGHARVEVPAGQYLVRGEPVKGFELTPQRQVSVGTGVTAAVPLTYVIGIQ